MTRCTPGGSGAPDFHRRPTHTPFPTPAPPPPPKLRYLTILKRVTAQKGIAGTLDGFFPWGCLQAIAKGSVFSWGQAASSKWLQTFGGNTLSKEQRTVLSGGMGGAVQGVVMSPLLLLKTRVMTDPTFRGTGGLLATSLASARVGGRIVASEGPAALFKGVTVFSAKRAADWTTRYLFVVMVEEAMRTSPNAKLSETQSVVASLLGGSISAIATIPIDVIVSTTQSAAKAGKKVGILETFREQGGLANVVAFSTRGSLARVMHVALTTAVMVRGGWGGCAQVAGCKVRLTPNPPFQKNFTSFAYDILFPVPK